MRKNDLVSVITPVYNCKNVFKDTFLSMISQTYKNIEWIIIDDCSTDDSFNLISKYANDYSFIKVIHLEKNGGSAKARNLGLDVANGKYITFLDGDDMIDESYIQEQVDFIKANGPIVTCGYRRKGIKTTTEFMPRDNIRYKNLLYGCDLSCLTTMYDRTYFSDVRFPEHILKDEDYVFWLEILNKGYVVKTNKRVLATYRISRNSKNGNKTKALKPLFNVYHNVLKMNIFRTVWHLFCYFLYGVKKYHNVK